jgi:hypothetical protein
VMDEVNARRGRAVVQREARVHGVGSRPARSAIEPHREQDGGQEGDGDDGAPSGGAGTVQHG